MLILPDSAENSGSQELRGKGGDLPPCQWQGILVAAAFVLCNFQSSDRLKEWDQDRDLHTCRLSVWGIRTSYTATKPTEDMAQVTSPATMSKGRPIVISTSDPPS